MTILDAAFWAVCLVLVASGATKVAEPASFARALSDLGLLGGRHADDGGRGEVVGRWAAVLVGVVEIGVGLNGLVLGGSVVAGLAAAAYVVFTAVVLVARRRGLASCGCFGARSGTPTLIHATVNLGSAAVCVAAAVVGPVALAEGLEGMAASAAAAVVAGLLAVAVAIVVVDTR